MLPLPRLLAACFPALLVLLSTVEGALSDEPYLETPKLRHSSPCGEQQRRRRSKQSHDRFVYQAYYGATAEVDLKQLAEDQVAAGWTEAANPEDRGVTYSVIVVEWRHHHSNLFRDQERVRAHTGGSEGGTVVLSVQFASPFPRVPYNASRPPFFVNHPAGADKRVLVVYASDLVGTDAPLDDLQVLHLKASCENPSQTTVLVMADETCQRPGVPDGIPQACLSNVVRFYPFNTASLGVESLYAYMPLGPRSTFQFLDQSAQRDASYRPLLFNLEVSARTSTRREELIEITRLYTGGNPDVPCVTQSGEMDAEQWQELLLGSKFTLSPGGHNAETYRMWEALEAGSIPIVSKLDYTHPAYNGTANCGVGEVAWNTVAASPFARDASVGDWTELPALLDRLRQEPDDYVDRLQDACRLWYAAVMNQTYASLLNFGEGNELFPQEGPLLDDVVKTFP